MPQRTFLLIAALATAAWCQPSFNKPVTRLQHLGPPENAILAYSNGLFRSKDAGQTWTAIHFLEPGVEQPAITEILVHPTNPRIVYAFTSGSPGARVWKSADGGERWTEASTGLPANADEFSDPSIITRNPDTLYLLAGTDVYVTRNGGEQWTKLTTLTRGGNVSGVASIGFTAAQSAPGRLYAWSGANILRSDDDGATWRSLPILRRLDSAQILDAAVHPRNADEIVLVAQYYQNLVVRDASTLVTTDGGNTWTERSPKGTTAILAVDPFGGYHYRGCCGDHCRSTNQATTWSCTALGQGPRDWSFDEQTSGLIYFGEANGVSRSTDGGATRTVITGTVRPTLEKQSPAPRLSIPQGTVGSFTLPVRSVEQNDWRLPFTISDVPPWLQLSTLSGETPASVTATIDTARLTAGTHTAELTLNSPQASAPTKWAFTVIVTPASAGPPYSSATIGGGGISAALGFTGAGTQARLTPQRIAVDASGNVYTAIATNSIHKLDSQNRITHFAGVGTSGSTGDGGSALSAQIPGLTGLVAVGSDVYLFQNSPSAIRKISGGVITTAATAQQMQFVGSGRLRAGRDGTIIWATGATIQQYSIAAQSATRIYQGSDVTYTDVAVGPGSAYYVLNTTTNQVWQVRNNVAPILVAGTGLRGFAGDGGRATEALLNAPNAIAVGADGTLFIADAGNNRVRSVTSDGIIRTIAGDGRTTGTPTGELATQMPFDRINDIAVSASGELIISDAARVYRLTRAQVVPAISSGGFVHQSTYQAVVAPGGYFSIFGANLAATSEIVSAATWPTRLAGVEVRIQGRLAPLYYVSPTQINGQMPYETTPGSATATVTTAGVTTNVVSAQVRTAAPGILVVVPNGTAVGDYVVAYATGVGPVQGQPATGDPAGTDPLPQATSTFSATIGGQPANVLYLGLTPGFVGLAQANVVIPSLPAGDHPLVITVDGVASNAATVPVR